MAVADDLAFEGGKSAIFVGNLAGKMWEASDNVRALLESISETTEIWGGVKLRENLRSSRMLVSQWVPTPRQSAPRWHHSVGGGEYVLH